ncbi:IS4 family transposase [Kitasatospora aureofaciens]|uniref:IS4 family transposase n=1 Tax=Kitasatospora aureofaciens TaxID=1894 RepID=UPI0027E0A6C5|nr:IS4 family transposase [Kitasatospora aureofaciens]
MSATPGRTRIDQDLVRCLESRCPCSLPDLVEEVLSSTRSGHRRQRLLPAPVVLYFVLAMTLFPGRGYLGVWSSLVGALDLDEEREPSACALRQARVRLGIPPLRALFERLRGVLGTPDAPSVFFRGLRTVAWDGTMLDVPDSEENCVAFPPTTNQKGRCGFAKVRLMVLVECGTRAVVQAAFGSRFASEQKLAGQLLGSLTPGMLLLADRNFFGFPLWRAASATGADLLWRVKGTAVLPVLSVLTDGSYLSRVKAPAKLRRGDPQAYDLAVRVVEAVMTVTCADGTHRTELYRFATTLVDAVAFPARELAIWHARRWEIESTYAALKVTQRGPGRVLRSRSPHGVEQEVYAYLVTHQLLRIFQSGAAAERDVEPRRVSFTETLSVVTHSIIQRTGVAPGRATEEALRARHKATTRRRLLAEKTRSRSYPRTRKRPVSSYPSHRPGDRPPSPKVHYTLTLTVRP